MTYASSSSSTLLSTSLLNNQGDQHKVEGIASKKAEMDSKERGKRYAKSHLKKLNQMLQT